MMSFRFLVSFFILLAEVATPAVGFIHAGLPSVVEVVRPLLLPTTTALFAAKKKKAKAKAGGGFGGGGTTAKIPAGVTPVKADKASLEKQWDVFAFITDLEIKPLGDPEDKDYVHFEVVDVFARCGGSNSNKQIPSDNQAATSWFRIGKVCVSDETTIEVALTLQRGLILWTAVHMRRELMALGKSSAMSLEVGYISPAGIYMGCESDGPLDEDEASYLKGFDKVSPSVLATVKNTESFGFRPDWNPPGFTYKRREKAALKTKKQTSKLEEILDSTSE